MGGGVFVDILGLSTEEDGTVRVFTDDNKLISLDSEHLTKDGVLYYTRIINFDKIFKNSTR